MIHITADIDRHMALVVVVDIAQVVAVRIVPGEVFDIHYNPIGSSLA